MATMNPLEKKARNSFIKGLLLSGVIGVVIIAIIVIQLINIKGEEKQRIDAQKMVTVLKQPVKSGEIITLDMTKQIKADAEVVPSALLTQAAFNDMSINEDETTRDVIAKIDIDANTILTTDMLAPSDQINTNDVRKQEYNMIALPADIETGETIDIRLRMPDGTDYIVVSKKVVTVLDEGGIPSLNTISLELAEGETLMMSNAIVEAYQIPGSRLYITRYVEPGLQAGAITTYVASGTIQEAIAANPNIVTEAKQELIRRINEQGGRNRGNINNILGTIDADERQTYVETYTGSEISTQQDERQKYLDGLGG